MAFTFENTYSWKAMTAMARGLRKTLQAKRSRRSHLFGGIVCVLGGLLLLVNPNLLTFLAIAVILLTLLFEDKLNGYIAWKQMPPGMETGTALFLEDAYTSVTPIGESKFPYEPIQALAETKEYYIFCIGPNHAQVYPKATLSGGTQAEFKHFLEEKTGKTFQIL